MDEDVGSPASPPLGCTDVSSFTESVSLETEDPGSVDKDDAARKQNITVMTSLLQHMLSLS